MNKLIKTESGCAYCQQKGFIHIHTDMQTYALNGFVDNEEAIKMFNIVCEKIKYFRYDGQVV